MSEDLRQAFNQTEAGPSAASGEVRDHAGERPRARQPGDVIADKYVLVRYLARGGMAEVWLGTHASLRTDVAIKFVEGHLAHDRATAPYALERFRFEAQISAQLGARTRHVVAVQDAGTHEGVPYLVMEYVPGRTLEAEVEAGGPMDPARFADVLDQVADALDAAHGLGIIHRDIKPSNLLLLEDPQGKLSVKVADFGVAKALSSKLALDRPRETQQGELVGSPAFMSPEQLRSARHIGAASDIWSVGVVAYETLTGHSCFEGSTLMDVFAAISSQRYRPASGLRPGLPRGIDAWIARALAMDPADRFGSVEEMAKSFRALLAAPPRASRRPLVAAVLLSAATLSAVLVVRGRAAAPAPPTTALPSAAAPSPSSTSSPASITAEKPVAVDAPELPPVPTAHAVRLPSPSARLPAPTATPPAAATPAHTAPAASATKTARGNKGIDPSEIQ